MRKQGSIIGCNISQPIDVEKEGEMEGGRKGGGE